MKAFFFSNRALDVDAYRRELADPAAGGYSAFEGWVRNHNEGLPVTRLEYEAFEALANKEGERIVEEAIRRFGVIKATCVHRIGSLDIGEMAVWVGVSSRHRTEAFAACRFIIDEVKHRVPIWKKEHYVNGDSGWVNCERCAEAAVSGELAASSQNVAHTHDHNHEAAGDGRRATENPQGACTHDHSGRSPSPVARRPYYSRQVTLREVGEAGQRKLRDARVLVIGAGGLGVPVLNYLAGAGVGTIGIAESDTLDASNLHRQPMYSFADVGQPKSQLAAQRLGSLNPDVHVHTHERIDSANAVALLSQYDLVVECSDNFATKFLVNDAAVRTGKPAIFASVYQYEGQLQVWRAEPGSACLRCLWPDATRDGVVGNCAEAGVLGPVPGVLGTLQALEALKILLDLPGQLKNEMLLIDLLTLDQRKLQTPRRADCIHDGTRELESTPADLEVNLSDLSEASRGYTLIDVRELREVREEPITAESRHIPLAVLLVDASSLSPAQKYLLVCARGARSRAAAEHLRSQGFTHAYSLAGGLQSMRQEGVTMTERESRGTKNA